MSHFESARDTDTVMDPAAAASAIVEAAAVALSELRHHRAKRAQQVGLREPLLSLEHALWTWAFQARRTNEAAVEWAAGLPATAGQAANYVADAMNKQVGWLADVRDSFEWPLRDRLNEWRPLEQEARDVEDFLRVYAPQVLDLAPSLVARREILREIPGELERRWRGEGRCAVEEYLEKLDETWRGVEEFRRELAEFIRQEFPPPS